MDIAAKKHAPRLVPYGLYLAGAKRADGTTCVSLVSWFTQTSFEPPLVVLGMHREGEAFKAAQATGVLAVSLIGLSQKELIKPFFKHVEVVDGRAGPLEVKMGQNGCPLLPALPAGLELKVRQVTELGDHATVLFEVTEAHIFDKEARAISHEAAGLHYAG